MKDKINNELLKIQEDLNAIDNAVKHIEKAGQLSHDIINNTKDIYQKYKEHLDKTLEGINEFLNSSYRHTEKTINQLLVSHKAKIEEEEKILEKYTELSIKTEDLTHEYLKKIVQDHSRLLENSTIEAEKIIKQTAESSEKLLQRIIEDTEKKIGQLQEVTRTYVSNTENQINSLINLHQQHLEQLDKVLNNYLELAQSTAQLSENINSIDFPQQFIKTQNIIAQLISEQNATNASLNRIIEDTTNEIINENVQKQNRKIKTLTTVIIAMFVFIFLCFGFFGFAVYKLIPGIFSMMFN